MGLIRNILMLYFEVTENKGFSFTNSQWKVFTEIVIYYCSVK